MYCINQRTPVSMTVIPNQQLTHYRLRMRRMRRNRTLPTCCCCDISLPRRVVILLSSTTSCLVLLLVIYHFLVGNSGSTSTNTTTTTTAATSNSNHGSHSFLRAPLFSTMIRTRPQSNNNNNNNSNTSALQQWVHLDSQPFNQHNEILNANHLIMVAGHSVTISGHLQDAGEDETDWYLLPYQKGKGLPQTILAHIREGIRLAAMDPRSLLIFSGGETRATTGPENEGTSYFRVADAMDLWDEGMANGKNVRARTTSEEFATDSFQNLLFSICRFREITGAYPEKITTVSFTFKKTRFETMHSRAILWPSDQFVYVGVDPDASTGFNLEEATKGEMENAAKPFQEDPYGCHTSVLQEKRRMRNPFHRTPPYEITCPEMKELLQWCGPNIIGKEKVPW
jgi:hypothetical protein